VSRRREGREVTVSMKRKTVLILLITLIILVGIIDYFLYLNFVGNRRFSQEKGEPRSDIEAKAYIDLAWDANQDPDLGGYRVYYGTSPREYTNFMDVGNVTNFRLDELREGVTYYIAVTAYDMSGNESDFSEEVSGIGLIAETSGGSEGGG
jgi:hypothetical protein